MHTLRRQIRCPLMCSTLAATLSLTLFVGAIPASAQNQTHATCADPRGATYCKDEPQPPFRLVCCVNPNPLAAPQLKVTPAAARPGETVAVEGSMLSLEGSGSATVFFDWAGQDGTLIDGDVSGVELGPVVQFELVVPPAPTEEGVLCVRGALFPSACTTFTILPETTRTDLNPENGLDNP